MNREEMSQLLEEAPVIAAVKDLQGLNQSLTCDAKIVFVLFGTIVSIPEIVQRIQQAGKKAIVHLDLIDGLAAKEVAVDYITESTAADGIISTKPTLVRAAREKGLLAIRRFFLLDSMALRMIEKQLAPDGADFIEVLPGVMPKILRKIAANAPVPLIAGGLISDKEDVVGALAAGAVGVSSTAVETWCM